MKTFRSALFVAAAVLSLAFAGCGGIKPGGITETLVAFHATDASLAESRATLSVRYANENISALGFSGATHSLYLNGTYVGKVASKQPFGIPPMNATTQDVTVQLENVALVRQLIAVGGAQTAAYRLESVLSQTINEDNYEYKVNAQGAVDLHADAPAAK